jgi:hypothetical protein
MNQRPVRRTTVVNEAMLFQRGQLEAVAPEAERPTMGIALMPSSGVPSTVVLA